MRLQKSILMIWEVKCVKALHLLRIVFPLTRNVTAGATSAFIRPHSLTTHRSQKRRWWRTVFLFQSIIPSCQTRCSYKDPIWSIRQQPPPSEHTPHYEGFLSARDERLSFTTTSWPCWLSKHETIKGWIWSFTSSGVTKWLQISHKSADGNSVNILNGYHHYNRSLSDLWDPSLAYQWDGTLSFPRKLLDFMSKNKAVVPSSFHAQRFWFFSEHIHFPVVMCVTLSVTFWTVLIILSEPKK